MLRLLLFIGLLVAGFTCGIVGSIINYHRLDGLAGFLIGAGVAVFAYTNVCEGVSSSNWGTFRRDQEPLRFWCDILVLALFAAVFMIAGLWAMLG
jgi:hypothetical protein